MSDDGIKKIDDIDIDRGMTISQFMAKKGVEGGIELEEAQDDPSSSKSDLKDAIVSEDGRKYEMGDVVGRGGMGMVLSAKDVNIRRKIAMKVALTGSKDIDDDQLIRFISEAQVTGQLEHPSIVPVYELGVDASENVFYTMKLIKGDTLKDILNRIKAGDEATIRAYPLNHLLNIFLKTCDAIAYAHSKGVIHRDLKPENIMVGEYGEVVVLDWGLAKVISSDDENSALTEAGKALADGDRVKAQVESIRHDDDSGTYMTMAGVAMGTPQFMAPEQAFGDVDALSSRTDIYALGGILYQILSLRTSVTGNNVNMILLKLTSGQLDPLENNPDDADLPHLPTGKVPTGLAAVAMKALALDPKDRYASVKAMQTEVEKWQTGFATDAEGAGFLRQLVLFVRRNRREFLMVGAAAMAIAGIVAWASVSNLHERRAAERARDVASKQRDDTKAALDRLRQSSDAFYSQAQLMLREGRFDAAHMAIRQAIELDGTKAGYFVLSGDICLVQLQVETAEEQYSAALRLDSDLPGAEAGLLLCRACRKKSASAESESVIAYEIFSSFVKQNRMPEAMHLSGRLERRREALWKAWKPRFDKTGLKAKAFRQREDGEFLVGLTGTGLKNLTPLRQLIGIPIHTLNLHFNGDLEDLGPLTGFKLKSLRITSTKINDLSPLVGMPLGSLGFSGSKRSYAPLKGLPLETISFAYTNIKDLSFLKGPTLKRISMAIGNNQLKDLSALRGCPNIETISPPEHARLDVLPDLPELRVVHLAGFRNRWRGQGGLGPLMRCSKLHSLSIPPHASSWAGFEELRRHPTLQKVNGKPVAQFWKAYDAKKKEGK